MIVYNVTVKVDLSIDAIWVRWMKEEHIPRVMATGCFSSYKMYSIMEEDQADGRSYAIQYFTDNISNYFDYQKNHAPALQKETADTFPNKYHAFRTLLREI
ncbi:MAG: DUF4286 family protein [Chitinophagales bacterium]